MSQNIKQQLEALKESLAELHRQGTDGTQIRQFALDEANSIYKSMPLELSPLRKSVKALVHKAEQYDLSLPAGKSYHEFGSNTPISINFDDLINAVDDCLQQDSHSVA